jgi:hypothetical protein
MHVDEDSQSKDPAVKFSDLSAAEESDNEDATDNEDAPSAKEADRAPTPSKGGRSRKPRKGKKTMSQTLEGLPRLGADYYAAAAQPEKICGFRTQRRTPKRKSTSDSEGSAGQGGVKCEYTGTNYHNGVYRTSIYYAKPGSGAFLPLHVIDLE